MFSSITLILTYLFQNNFLLRKGCVFLRIKRINQNDIKLSNTAKVKVKTTGNTQVVQFTAGNNKKCSVVNLSKDTYLNKITGEIKHKKKSESRYQSPKSVRKSINKLMDLIRCNATEPAKCKWLTVTYAETMTDGKQAFLDAKLFLRKLRRMQMTYIFI